MFKCGLASRLTGCHPANRGRHQRKLPIRCTFSRHCCPTSGRSPEGTPASAELSRRTALLAATSSALWPQPAAAETATANTAPAPPAKPQASQKEFKTFNERDFVLEVPRGFKEQQDPAASEFGAGGRPKSTYERVAALTPLRVKFASEDGQELITVIQRNASELKQSFLQITDISQLGSVTEVASILLPREVQVLAADSVTVPQEPRDTGTVFGTLQLPPQTIYRYTFRTRGQRAHLVVVAKAGKVYLAAGSAKEDRWGDASDRLKAAVVSFRLV